MKSYSDWKLFLEDNDRQVKSAFEQLRQYIQKMFGQLYRAAQNTWGRGKVDDKLKTDIIGTLESLISRIRGGAGPALPKAEAVRNLVGVEMLVCEALVDGLRPTGRNSETGRDVFNMQDVLKQIEDRIMRAVDTVEKSIIMQRLGDIRDRTASVQAGIHDLGQDVGGVGKKVDDLDGKVGSGMDDLRGDIAGYGQAHGSALDAHGKALDKISGKIGRIPGRTSGLIKPDLEDIKIRISQGKTHLADGEEISTAQYNLERIGSFIERKSMPKFGITVTLAPAKDGARKKDFDVQDPAELGEVLQIAKSFRFFNLKINKGGREMVRYTIDLGQEGNVTTTLDQAEAWMRGNLGKAKHRDTGKMVDVSGEPEVPMPKSRAEEEDRPLPLT